MKNKLIKVGLIGRQNIEKTYLLQKLIRTEQTYSKFSKLKRNSKKNKNNQESIKFKFFDFKGDFSELSYLVEPVNQKDNFNNVDYSLIDIFACVVDINNLHLDLYFILQLLEQVTKPVVLILNGICNVKNNQNDVDINYLSTSLSVPIIKINNIRSKRNFCIFKLKKQFLEIYTKNKKNNFSPNYLKEYIEIAKDYFHDELYLKNFKNEGIFIRALEGNKKHENILAKQGFDFSAIIKRITANKKHDVDVSISKDRYNYIKKIINNFYLQKKQIHFNFKQSNSANVTNILDNLFLNRLFGIPMFFLIMYLMFMFSIKIGGAFQDFFYLGSKTIFVDGMKVFSEYFEFNYFFKKVLIDGIGRGINISLTFIPVLFFMFLFLSFLEKSNYIIRSSFLIDKCLRILGLPGKAFIPMIMGFGCNVPAILSARTLENNNDKITTILMTPFMSCSARLAIYTIFVTSFYSNSYAHNIIFALYIIGILVAVFTGVFLKKFFLKEDKVFVLSELPEYKIPSLRSLVFSSFFRLNKFIMKAIKLIIPICIAISLFTNIKTQYVQNDFLDKVARSSAYLFKPIGIKKDNWPAVISLISGAIGKEAMIGTLNSLYTQDDKLKDNLINSEGFFDKISIKEKLKNSFFTIFLNFKNIKNNFFNPFFMDTGQIKVDDSFVKVMHEKFENPFSVFAYLIFVLLYFPCISVLAAISKELNFKWAIFSVFWSTGIAYFAATFFYQIAVFYKDPLLSLIYIFSSLLIFIVVPLFLHFFSYKNNKNPKNTLLVDDISAKISVKL